MPAPRYRTDSCGAPWVQRVFVKVAESRPPVSTIEGALTGAAAQHRGATVPVTSIGWVVCAWAGPQHIANAVASVDAPHLMGPRWREGLHIMVLRVMGPMRKDSMAHGTTLTVIVSVSSYWPAASGVIPA